MTSMAWTFSTAVGLLMAATTAVGSPGPAVVAAALAGVAVLVGVVFRPAATLAVLFAVSAIVASDPPAPLAALAGLFAAGYLVLRPTPAGVVTATRTTMIAAVGFTVVGLVATAFPFQLPWLPLLAPPAVFAIYVLSTRPFLG